MDELDETIDEMLVVHPWYGRFALVAFVALVAASNVGTALSARWANSHPAGLIALSSRNRHLLLVVAKGISVPSYVGVATIRLLLAAAVCHLLGRAYGDKALRWLVRFLGLAPTALDRFQHQFETAQWVLIPFFVGSNIIGVLTGVHRTPIKKFVGLMLVGIAARLALLWWLAKQFESQLKSILDFMQRWQYPLIIFSVAFVILSNVRNFRRGAG